MSSIIDLSCVICGKPELGKFFCNLFITVFISKIKELNMFNCGIIVRSVFNSSNLLFISFFLLQYINKYSVDCPPTVSRVISSILTINLIIFCTVTFIGLIISCDMFAISACIVSGTFVAFVASFTASSFADCAVSRQLVCPPIISYGLFTIVCSSTSTAFASASFDPVDTVFLTMSVTLFTKSSTPTFSKLLKCSLLQENIFCLLFINASRFPNIKYITLTIIINNNILVLFVLFIFSVESVFLDLIKFMIKYITIDNAIYFKIL